MYYRVAPFHHATVGYCNSLLYSLSQFSFPPRNSRAGSIGSLFESAFQWAPNFSWTFAFPRYQYLWPSSDLWPAFAWW